MTFQALLSSCAVHTGCGRGTEIACVATEAILVIKRSPVELSCSEEANRNHYTAVRSLVLSQQLGLTRFGNALPVRPENGAGVACETSSNCDRPSHRRAVATPVPRRAVPIREAARPSRQSRELSRTPISNGETMPPDKRVDRILDWDPIIDRMQLIEIDTLEPQPLQAVRTSMAQMLGSTISDPTLPRLRRVYRTAATDAGGGAPNDRAHQTPALPEPSRSTPAVSRLACRLYRHPYAPPPGGRRQAVRHNGPLDDRSRTFVQPPRPSHRGQLRKARI